jgi:SAM-dependent methyltransferase
LTESWSSGAAYEPFIGRWSRLVAAEFVAWLGQPPGLRWLDVGCGTGALTATVLRDAAPASVVGVDPTEAYVTHAAAHVADPRAEFRVGDARALPVTDGEFDVVVSGLVLNFVPDPAAAVAEIARAVRPGGTAAAYVWDYGPGGILLLRTFWDVAVALDPAAARLDEAARFPLCGEGALAEAFAACPGLDGVEARAITVPTMFRDFADYWTPFLGAQGPAPAYLASLDGSARDRLRDALRERLPADSDGGIALTARAWAVRATG